MAKILVIEDDEKVRSSLKRLLESETYCDGEKYSVETAQSGQKGIACAERDDFDAVITDLQMPEGSGHEVVRSLRQSRPSLPVILITAHHTTDDAIQSTKLGAFDYVLKPIDEPRELIEKVKRAVDNKRLLGKSGRLDQSNAEADAMIGRSRPMQTVFKEIGRLAARPITVLVRGETGTGKELMSRALHQHSDRADKPFIVVNCVAIPETLLESELFGHEAGAFTGAAGQRIGRFEQANGGTIFLDEIGDMTIETQAKLLRVLQEKTIQRLGGKEPISVDVRVIAATHRDLERAMGEKSFREDLYHRLTEAVISVPPLRERPDDIPELVTYFLQRQASELGITPPTLIPEEEVLKILEQRLWPGNVRELKNLVHRALLAARGAITPEIVKKALEQPKAGSEVPAQSTEALAAKPETVAEHVARLLAQEQGDDTTDLQTEMYSWARKEIYEQAMRFAAGNLDKVAALLGVTKSTAYQTVRQYGLEHLESPIEEPVTADQPKARILIVEDFDGDAIGVERFLQKSGHQTEVVTNMAAALQRVQKENFDLVLTDLDLKVPGASGLELIGELRVLKPHLPVILLTGYHSPTRAIQATRLGAYDYLTKPLSWSDAEKLAELGEMVHKAVQGKRLMEAPPIAVGEPSGTTDAIIGKSRPMQEVYKEIGRVAATPLTVLIRGETGTGKELVARALWSHSDRGNEPFIVVNCAAIPPSLLESELFGHERGAFTNANVRRLGRFEQANKGTIFLDEIGDMNIHLQQKLLRVLQEKTIERVGGEEPIPVDVRVIAATHRDLERASRDGTFRQDLYFRLNVAVIQLPALRERPEDIPDLVSYFIQRSRVELGAPTACLEPTEEGSILQFLEKQPWPGNVRELRNAVRKALIACRGFPLRLDTFRETLGNSESAHSPTGGFAARVARELASTTNGDGEKLLTKLLDEAECELYWQAMKKTDGDQTQMAKLLGVSKPTVATKLRKHDIRSRLNME